MKTNVKQITIIGAIAINLALFANSGFAANFEKNTRAASTTDQYAFDIGVVEPPENIDDYAIVTRVEPPRPATNNLKGNGGNRPPKDFEIDLPRQVAIDWMAAYIDSVMENQVVGYAYVINKDGQMVASNAQGYARTVEDGNLPMSINTRSFTASVTKQITAIATIKILHAAGLTVDEPIESYLPKEWGLGFGFWGANGVTFRHLMTHTTGLGQMFAEFKENNDQTALSSWGNDWDGLEWVVLNGANPGASSSYKNANYAFLRLLIPAIWVEMGGAPYAEVTEGNHAIMYIAYVQQQIFEPIGINNVVCWIQGGQEEALAYSKDFIAEGGIAHELFINTCGGYAGLRLSVYELAKYLAYLRHSDEIITTAQLVLANQDMLGWDSSNGAGWYWKGGAWSSKYTMALENNFDEFGLALDNTVEYSKSSYTCIMTFPYGYEASIVINSEYKTSFESSKCGVLKDAFEFVLEL